MIMTIISLYLEREVDRAVSEVLAGVSFYFIKIFGAAVGGICSWLGVCYSSPKV
jgi:hypothetical protein